MATRPDPHPATPDVSADGPALHRRCRCHQWPAATVAPVRVPLDRTTRPGHRVSRHEAMEERRAQKSKPANPDPVGADKHGRGLERRYGTNAPLKASSPAGLVHHHHHHCDCLPSAVTRATFLPSRSTKASSAFLRLRSPLPSPPPPFLLFPSPSKSSPPASFFLCALLCPVRDRNGIPRRGAAAAQDQHRQRRPHGRRRVRGGREPAVAAVAQAAAGDQLLRAMQDARGRTQVRVQHVLPRLRQRRALLPVPRLPPRPPRHPDKEVLLPRRDPRVGDPEGAGHHRRADIHHQQRARRLPQRAPAAQARQGRHQHLRRLRAQPPRHLPLLLPRMQDRGHLRRVPRPEEARGRQEDEAEAEEGGGVGLGRLVHHHQRR